MLKKEQIYRTVNGISIAIIFHTMTLKSVDTPIENNIINIINGMKILNLNILIEQSLSNFALLVFTSCYYL